MVPLAQRLGWKRRAVPVTAEDETQPVVVPPIGLLERVSDALFSLNHAWRFTYLNPAAERLFAQRREELLGQNIWERSPETVGSVFDQQYRRAVADRLPVHFEACHPPAGTWVQVRAYPTEDGLQVHAHDITPDKRAADSLRRWVQFDEVRFRALVEHAADIVGLLNADGTVRYVSQAIEHVLGYAPEEWIGSSAFAVVHPDDRPRFRRLFDEEAQRQGITALAECRLRHADGSWRPIEIVGNNLLSDPSIAGLVVTARDITERKAMEAELHAREATFKAIFDGAAIGIGASDLSGHLLAANRALQEILGAPDDALHGLALADFTHPDDRQIDSELLSALVSGRRDHYQVTKRFVREDGRLVWGNLTVSLIRDSDGNPQFAIDMVDDVTERQRAATELAAARRRLAASRESERLRLARELHDGPVQDLIAISYQLADRRAARTGSVPRTTAADAVLDAERQRILAVVGQLRGVIGELRPPGLAEFGLPAALRGYVARLKRDGNDGVPAIVLDLDEQTAHLPQPLAVAVFRVVQEALRNCVRHARAHQITVRLRKESAEVTVDVQDDGRGFRVPDRLDELAQGGHFGLVGLAERVEQADGELTVTSAPGAGTTIAVRFPIVDEGDGDEQADPGVAGR